MSVQDFPGFALWAHGGELCQVAGAVASLVEGLVLTLAWPLVRFRRHHCPSQPSARRAVGNEPHQGMHKSSYQARKQASTVSSSSVARCLWKR